MAIPSYESVPEHWRTPFGPYRQAPPEYGGRWYYVNPFTGLEPWKRDKPPARTIPPGFLEIFGPEPQANDYHGAGGNAAFQAARDLWLQDLKHFKQAGTPPGFSAEQISAAVATFEAWGMGRPRFYEGRYGWVAAFPDSQVPDFRAWAPGAIEATHQVIAQYQFRALSEGLEVEQEHPFVPPRLFSGEEPEPHSGGQPVHPGGTH